MHLGSMKQKRPHKGAQPEAERIVVRPRVPILEDFDDWKWKSWLKYLERIVTAMNFGHLPWQDRGGVHKLGDEIGRSEAMGRFQDTIIGALAQQP